MTCLEENVVPRVSQFSVFLIVVAFSINLKLIRRVLGKTLECTLWVEFTSFCDLPWAVRLVPVFPKPSLVVVSVVTHTRDLS